MKKDDVNWEGDDLRPEYDVMQLKGGVRIRDIYWTIGPYDLVGIFDADSDEAATAALLQLGAQGNVRTTTMRAWDEAEHFEFLKNLP